MQEPLNARIVYAHKAGLLFGFAICVRMVFWGLIYYIGSIVIQNYGYEPMPVFLSMYVLINATMGAGV